MTTQFQAPNPNFEQRVRASFRRQNMMDTLGAIMTGVTAGSVEFKVNLLAPAVGDRMIAQARVIRAGQSLTVCTGDLFAASDMHDKQVATMLATMRAVRNSHPD